MHLEEIVSITVWVDGAVKKKNVFVGGSSNVFNSAFAAWGVSRFTSSIVVALFCVLLILRSEIKDLIEEME